MRFSTSFVVSVLAATQLASAAPLRRTQELEARDFSSVLGDIIHVVGAGIQAFGLLDAQPNATAPAGITKPTNGKLAGGVSSSQLKREPEPLFGSPFARPFPINQRSPGVFGDIAGDITSVLNHLGLDVQPAKPGAQQAAKAHLARGVFGDIAGDITSVLNHLGLDVKQSKPGKKVNQRGVFGDIAGDVTSILNHLGLDAVQKPGSKGRVAAREPEVELEQRGVFGDIAGDITSVLNHLGLSVEGGKAKVGGTYDQQEDVAKKALTAIVSTLAAHQAAGNVPSQ